MLRDRGSREECRAARSCFFRQRHKGEREGLHGLARATGKGWGWEDGAGEEVRLDGISRVSVGSDIPNLGLPNATHRRPHRDSAVEKSRVSRERL